MRGGLFWLNDKQWARIEPHLPTGLTRGRFNGGFSALVLFCATLAGFGCGSLDDCRRCTEAAASCKGLNMIS